MSVSLIDGHIDREEQKMTDNEIIKALELCKQNTVCTGCPYISTKMGCQVGLIGDALDLINRKDEQIEALIAGQETLQKALNEKIEEVERLQKLYDGANYCIDELEYAFDKVGHSNTRVDYALEKYRNFVKEMVGEG